MLFDFGKFLLSQPAFDDGLAARQRFGRLCFVDDGGNFFVGGEEFGENGRFFIDGRSNGLDFRRLGFTLFDGFFEINNFIGRRRFIERNFFAFNGLIGRRIFFKGDDFRLLNGRRRVDGGIFFGLGRLFGLFLIFVDEFDE